MNNNHRFPRGGCGTARAFGVRKVWAAFALLLGAAGVGAGRVHAAPVCARTLTADVVAFEQVYTYNRYGSFNPAGLMYALKRDVVAINPVLGIVPGNVQLRPAKRPRPLVLRANEGDCLRVTFTNLLSPARPEGMGIDAHTGLPASDAPATRSASMSVAGLDYLDIASSGSNVGQNASSLAAPGQTRVYNWYAARQGQFLITSQGAPVGGEGDSGQPILGLFGAVNVEPKGAKWYRSQITGADLAAVKTGLNPNGTPKINYDKLDAGGNPILAMLKGNEIVHTDLNAIVTGFTENCVGAPPSSTCGQAFREFTVIFHDEIKAVQAFAELDADYMHALRDGFAINYGSQGAGAPVVATRTGKGPAANCGECKLEEFFLTSWANGDPAMIVRKDGSGRSVEALYPDDPSNVHHSYLGDPVRFRNLHVGKETHIFHLHAHQWLLSPRDENSTYLDSQTISPGGAYTYEINYGGSGNRNFTAGDSIFHCHLYPHFAQGMWELWRVHDVFEQGTPDRNLPDAEISGGTPNPAVLPIPNKPMAPLPTATFKGYPFYVAAQAGHRPPQPPMDMEPGADGGLPRHRIASATVVDGAASIESHFFDDPIASRVLSQRGLGVFDPALSLARKLESANIELLPADGTTAEKAAFNFHAGVGGVNVTTKYGWPAKGYVSYTSSGSPGYFLVNGLPSAPGAPFADPCKPGSPTRSYRVSYVQFDMPVNRAGWHDPQARILVLDQDVQATLDGTRPPEPLFFRANSGECVTTRVTNLIPSNLNVDDFQVFTPTDTMGQHIHLVKFDVMSADGSGNGWNYEDGTFSPDEVRERIAANNAYQAAIGGTRMLAAKPHPVHGSGPNGAWIGAQTTTQRWWVDPLLNNAGQDRTIRTVFTHDHFGPSSHQHHGFYAAFVIEPTGSSWQALDGKPLGTRTDGGPTSYAANIVTKNVTDSAREFNLAWSDFAIVYTGAPENRPVNPPARVEKVLPFAVESLPNQPEAISAGDPGSQLVNYRHEPIPLRIASLGDGGDLAQKTGAAGDMAHVFSSAVHGDPFTPLLKAYEGDRVQIRSIQGGQEENHILNIHGIKWLLEGSSPNSGWTNAQYIGISEHMEFILGAMPDFTGRATDYLYSSAATDNLWDGLWGLLRTYQGLQPGLAALPNNPTGRAVKPITGVCPSGAPQRRYSVKAVRAADLLPGGALVYSRRFDITDPNAVLLIDATEEAALAMGTRQPEPLILRAAAGDCVKVTLTNALPATLPDGPAFPDSWSWTLMPIITNNFNFNQVQMSSRIGLHPQLLFYDPNTDDGAHVGSNPDSTVGAGETRTYTWYAGELKFDSASNQWVGVPIEFGATSLRPMGDVIKHSSHGAVGALIVEPKGAMWSTVDGNNHTADVKDASGNVLFREFVLINQDDLSLKQHGQPMLNFGNEDDSEDTSMKGFNYRTEPIWARLGLPSEASFGQLNDKDMSNLYSSTGVNDGCAGPCGDAETPVFVARANTPVRFRVLYPAGHPRNTGFNVLGHHWQYAPWTGNSTAQGDNPRTWETGMYGGIGPTRHLNILTTAGGLFGTPGDYLYRNTAPFVHTGGMWGLFRVTP